jgi:ssDNA-binding Zn-finger/Zn-ribbon topoisomerase 1
MSANKPTENVKGVQITLTKSLAERLSFLRRLRRHNNEINAKLSDAMEGVIAMMENRAHVKPDSWKGAKTCPSCATGVLLEKRARDKEKPPFLGCSRYPDCKHTENLGMKSVKNKGEGHA